VYANIQGCENIWGTILKVHIFCRLAISNDSFHSSGVSGSLHPIQETFSELNILVLHVHVVHVVGVRTIYMKMVYSMCYSLTAD
jgi:hypothetical protein